MCDKLLVYWRLKHKLYPPFYLNHYLKINKHNKSNFSLKVNHMIASSDCESSITSMYYQNEVYDTYKKGEQNSLN